MKKFILLLLAIWILFCSSACGTTETNINPTNTPSESQTDTVKDTTKTSSNEEISQEPEITSDVTVEQENSSTTSTTTESITSTTSAAEVKPLNERIVCGECCYYGLLGNVEEVETAVLYQQFDELKCCKCGLVDGEDYKAGDYIYVLPE